MVVTLLAVLRPGALVGSVSTSKGFHEFNKKISGSWWQKINPDESSALSYIKIKYIQETTMLKLSGTAYNKKGEKSANWETAATTTSLMDSKVFYYWKGFHIKDLESSFEGFGEIHFDDSQKKIVRGKGWYSDTDLRDFKTTKRKSTDFRRCTPEEMDIMDNGDTTSKSDILDKAMQYF
jgi:hypothetical protein